MDGVVSAVKNSASPTAIDYIGPRVPVPANLVDLVEARSVVGGCDLADAGQVAFGRGVQVGRRTRTITPPISATELRMIGSGVIRWVYL